MPACRCVTKWALPGTWPMRRCFLPPTRPTSLPASRCASTAAAHSTSAEDSDLDIDLKGLKAQSHDLQQITTFVLYVPRSQRSTPSPRRGRIKVGVIGLFNASEPYPDLSPSRGKEIAQRCAVCIHFYFL